MYSVTELSKIFKTTRVTIYNKFKDKDIQQYVKSTKQGKKLEKEGFNMFQLLMSQSKVNDKITQNESKVNNSLKDDYINSLKEQIVKQEIQIKELKQEKNELKQEKNELKEEKKTEIEYFKNQLQQTQLILTTEKPKNKSWWEKLFKN